MSKRVNARMHGWMLAAAILVGLPVPAAVAQVVLESAANTTLAGSGPAGSGPSVAAQVVTLRHNTDNPAGNTMVARPPAVTATFSLTNQQFTGLTAAQLYTAGTGGNAVFFGGGGSGNGGGGSVPFPLYPPLGDLGGPTSAMFTSANAATGQGIDATATTGANAGLQLLVSSNAIALQSPATPTNARVRMADLVMSFSAPVTNPVLHLAGLGGVIGGSGTRLGFAAELDMVTPGLSFSRLSGNTNFTVSGSQIASAAVNPSGNCATGQGACGSVRVNGTGITAITLRLFLRGDGAPGTWSGEPGSFNGDGLLIGVSVIEPPPTVTVRKVTTGGAGTFNFTGTNGYTATSVTTAVAGTAVDGTSRTVSAANTETTITEASTAGYRLTGINCSGLGAGSATVGTLPAAGVAGGGSVTLNAAAMAPGNNIVCTFSNQKLPILRVRKALPNGRIAATDQFTLRIASGATILQSVTSTGTDGAPVQVAVLDPATVGAAYTLSEIAAGGTNLANYAATYRCTNALSGGQTPSGSGTSFTVTPVAGDDLTCTFTNVANQTDVAILKTVDEATRLPGQSVQFTLLVSNNGAVDASGTQVRDPVVQGLACATVTCSASGTATCPTSPSVAALQSPSGLTLPGLPPGGSIRLLLTCTVTASGFMP